MGEHAQVSWLQLGATTHMALLLDMPLAMLSPCYTLCAPALQLSLSACRSTAQLAPALPSLKQTLCESPLSPLPSRGSLTRSPAAAHVGACSTPDGRLS